MRCPVCGIEMRKETAAVWICRNPRCVRYPLAGKDPARRETAAKKDKEEND